jgi:hypothetical protein
MLKFRLLDETGQLDVIVYKEDGERLFGLPAVNLRQNNVTRSSLEKKLTRLNQPGVKFNCCLKSYYARNPQNPQQTPKINFRLFDTFFTSNEAS